MALEAYIAEMSARTDITHTLHTVCIKADKQADGAKSAALTAQLCYDMSFIGSGADSPSEIGG